MTASRIEHLAEGKVALHCGDCLDLLKTLEESSVDSCVTDPPYGLGFMGKAWDHGVPGIAYWKQVFRVLKPGAHLLSFGGTRTFGRMHVAIEDAGFEIRDMISWLYGSGFPKSLDVSKAIDKAAGETRERIRGVRSGVRQSTYAQDEWTKENWDSVLSSDAITQDAKVWSGFGTALKPACEPIVLARKPLSESTVAANVLKWGTGALNIDGCRIATEVGDYASGGSNDVTGTGWGHKDSARTEQHSLGRWPANVIHDGSEQVVGAFPANLKSGTGSVKKETSNGHQGTVYGKENRAVGTPNIEYGDEGSAARFFYTAKADADDRLGSKHPTVKPLDLMQYLVRLVTPKGVLYCPKCEGRSHEKNSSKGASFAEGLCTLREDIPPEGQSTHGTILQPPVCGGSQGAETNSLRVMRDNLSAEGGRSAEILQQEMLGNLDCAEPIFDEGFCNQQSGLQTSVDADAPAIPFSEGVHLRASLDNATADRPPINEGRGGSSQERNKGGQSPGEFGIDAEGRSRQTESSASEHALLPSLPRKNNNESACTNCGHKLERRGGLCLDPFAGTGTTGEACIREGMRCILIEREPEYQADIRRRMLLVMSGPDERRREAIKAKTKDQPIDAGPLFGGASEMTRGADRFTATSPIRTDDWPDRTQVVTE